MAIKIPSLFDWAASERETRKKQREKTPVIIPSFDEFVKSERDKMRIEAQRRKAPLSLPPEDEISTPPTRRSPKTPIDYVGPIPVGMIPEEVDKTSADFLKTASDLQRQRVFGPTLSATDEYTLALIYDQDTAKEAKGIRAKLTEWPTTKLAKGLEKTVSKLQKLPGAKIPIISEVLGLGSKIFVDALFSLQGLFEISTGGKGIDEHRLLVPMYKQYADELRSEGITDIKNWKDFKKSFNVAMRLWSDEGATDKALKELGLRVPGELKEIAEEKYRTPLGSGFVVSELGRDLLNMGVEIAAVSYITSQIPLVGVAYKAMSGVPKEAVLGAIYTYAEQGAKHGRIPDWEEVQMNMMMFPVIGQTLRAAGRGMKYAFKGGVKAAIATPEMLEALKSRVNRSSLAYTEKYGVPPLTPWENLMISKTTGEVMPGERFWKLPDRPGAIPTEGFPEVLGKELPAYRAEMRKGTDVEREYLDRAPPDIPFEDDLIIEEIKRTPSGDLRNELHGAYGDDAAPYIAAMTRTELEYMVSGGRILPEFPVGDMTFQNVFSIDKLQRAARGKRAVEDIIGTEKDVSRETLEAEAEAEPRVKAKKPVVGEKAVEVKDKYVPGNAKDMKDLETVVRGLTDKGEIDEATKILDENIEWFPEDHKTIRARNKDLTQKEVNNILKRNRESNNKMKDLVERLERNFEKEPIPEAEGPVWREDWRVVQKRIEETGDQEFIDKVEAGSLKVKDYKDISLDEVMIKEIARRKKLVDEYSEKQKGPAEEKPPAPAAEEAKLPEGELTYEEFRKWAAENHPDENIREMAQAPESADPMSPHGLMLDVVWREARGKAEARKVEPKAEEKPEAPKEETWQEKRIRKEEESYQENVEGSMLGVWGALDNAKVDTKTLSTLVDKIISDAIKQGIKDNDKVFPDIMKLIRTFKGADESLKTAQVGLLDYWAAKRIAGTESRTLSELFKKKPQIVTKKAKGIWRMDTEKATIDPERFQISREKAFAEETAASVAKAEAETPGSVVEPITVWKDSADGKWYVLDGFSRMEGFRRAGTKDANFTEFKGTEAEAKAFAIAKNKQLATPLLFDDVYSYRTARYTDNWTQKKLAETYGSDNVGYLDAYSFLDPKGKFAEILRQPVQNEFPWIKLRGRWIGEIRKAYGDKLTNRHEDQLFDFMYKQAGKNYEMDKSRLFNLIEKQVSRFDWDPNNPLVLKRGEVPRTGTRARMDTAAAERKLDELREELKKARNVDQAEQVRAEIAKIQTDIADMVRDQQDIFGEAPKVEAPIEGVPKKVTEKAVTDAEKLYDALTKEVAEEHKRFEKPSELRKWANEQLGKEANVDDIWDALETVLVKLRQNRTDLKDYDLYERMKRVEEMERLLPSRPRTLEATSEINQQFSTPLELAEAMREAADIRSTDFVLEPTAGTGSLLAPFDKTVDTPARIVAIEISPRRVALLKRIGIDAKEANYLEIDVVKEFGERPDVILANPPWAGRGRSPLARAAKLPDIAANFVNKMLADLREGGRLVTLMPTTILTSSEALPWLRNVAKIGTIKGIVVTPEGMYTARRGTDVPSVMLVIDKGKAPEGFTGALVAQRPFTGAKGQFTEKDAEILRAIFNEFGDKEYTLDVSSAFKGDFADLSSMFKGMRIPPARHKLRTTLPRSRADVTPTVPEGAKAPPALPEVVPEGKIRIGSGDSAIDIDVIKGEPGGLDLGLPSRIGTVEKKWKLLGAFYGDQLDKIPEDIILKVNDLKSRGLDTRMMVADAPQNKAGLYRNSKGEWQKEKVKLYYLQGGEYVPVTEPEVEGPVKPAPEAGEPGRKPVLERERPEPGRPARPGEAPGGGRVPTERPGEPGELPGEGGIRPGVVPGERPGGRQGEPVSQRPAPEAPGESPKTITPVETKVINEIYSEYIPRYNLRGVTKHPSRIIESSHIAAVSKPNLNDVKLSERVIQSALDGKISDIQIDNVAATEKAFELYKNNPLGHAFVVADQVGVGKSRQAAAIAMQWLDSGRADVLLVMTKDKHAIKDLMREFDVISEGEKFPYPMYDIPRQFPETTNIKGGDIPKFDKAVYFMDWYNTDNYSEAITRLKPNGLIGDECHKWANVYDSDRGLAWKGLHKNLRGKDGGNLPTTYLSATTGEFIEGMEYLYNLGLWSPEEGSFGNWLRTLKGQLKGKAKRKPGGIESETSESVKEDVGSVFKSKLSRISPNMTEQIVAEFSMKGLASFRDILREGTEFEVVYSDITGFETPPEFRVPVKRVLPSVGRPGVLPSIKEIGEDFRKPADEIYSPKLNARTKTEIATATKHRGRYDKAVELMREYKTLYDKWKHLNKHYKKKSRFGFGAHSQELIKSLLFDIKLDMALPKATQYVKEGKQVVLSVIRVSGEARENFEGKQFFDSEIGLDAIDAQLNLPGRIRAMLDLLATRDFSKPESSGQVISEAEMAKAELTERFRNEWPMIDHPIEKIINAAGGRDKVALMVSSYTDLKGKKHMVKPADRAVDNQLFQDGKIRWSVISASGKESINLHDILGTGRRVYFYLDTDWSIKLLMQGFGRVDRTGQKSFPLIQFYNTGSAAEKRFYYSAVQRMSQLGATSKGTEAGVTGKTELAEYGIPRPLQRIAIQEAWEDLDIELKEWFIHKDYRDSYGNPHRRLENVDIEHFWRQFQFIPIEEGRLIGDVYQKAVRNVLYKNARDTFSRLEDEGIDVNPYWEEFNRGKIVQEILQERRHSGEILRDTQLKGDLTLHEVKDVDGHKYGVLSGMVTPNIMRIREHLPRSGSTAGGPRLDFIRFRSKDRVVSGLQIQKTRVKAVAAAFGRDVSGYKATPETMLSDLKAGDVITLQNGWRMYMGRGGARANKIIIQGAKMKDLTYKEAGINKVKAGAEYDPGGFFWIPKKNVPRFIKEYPISIEALPKPEDLIKAEGEVAQALLEGEKPTKLTTRIIREKKGVRFTGEDVIEESGTRLVTQKGEVATEKQIRRERKKLLKQIEKRKGLPVREQSVVEFLENEIGTPFRLGHHSWLRGKFRKTLGLFKIREQAVRLGTGYDLRVSTHELGHRVDQMLDMSKEAVLRDVHYDLIDLGTDLYPKAKVEVQIKEGFAEFMFDYLFSPKDARKHAPDFYEFFVSKVRTETPGLWEVMEKVIDDIAIMKNYDEAAFLHSIKSPGMKIRDDVAITDKIYNMVVEDAIFVKRAVTEAYNGKVPDDVLKDPYKRIILFRGWTAEAMSTLKKGWIDKNTGKKIAPGLEETLEPVRKVIDIFDDYYMGKALLESAKRGQEVPIPDWYKRLRKGPTIKDFDSPEYKKVYTDYSNEWQKKTAGEKKAEPLMSAKSYYEKIYQSAAILEEGNRLLLEKYPEFESVRQSVWEFGNRSLEQTVGHFMNRATFKMLGKRWPHHATLYRVFERDYAGGAKGSKFANLASPVKWRKGSFRPIISPLESLIKNHFMFTNMVGRNKIAQAYYRIGAEKPGMAKWVEIDIPLPLHVTKFQLAEITSFLKRSGLDISTSKDGKTGIVGDIKTAGEGQIFDLEHLAKIFRPSHFLRGKDNLAGVWFDGKYKVMRVHPRVYETFMGLDAEMGARAVKFFRLFGTPARMLRAGAILTPEFLGRNPMRDVVNSMVYSHYASKEPITRMVQKAYDFVWGIGEILGDTNYYHLWLQSGGAHGTMVSLDRNYLSKSLRSLLKQKMSQKMVNAIKPTSWLEALRMISEVPENATRLGEFRRALLKEGMGEEGVARGALASRDLTVDFQRMGILGKPMNQVIAFFNATIQGTDKMLREFKTRPVESTVYAFSYVTVPSYLLFLMNMDNPEYWKLSRWRRDLFWNIPITDDTWLTIPKPFELGIFFGALPERFFEAHYTNNPRPFREIAERIIDGGTPSLLPNVLVPAIEWMANKSIFTDIPLVPQAREEKGEEWFKYRGYTSETMKMIGKAFNISPSKMQNAMRAWTGGLGQHALYAFDYIGKNTGVFPEGPEKPSQPVLTTIPGVKGFIRRGGVSQNFWINEFYDLKKETDKASYMVQQLRGDELGEYITEHEKELDWSKDVNKEAKELSALRKQINEVYVDEKLSGDEKRFFIEGIYEEMGMIAKELVEYYYSY